MAKAEYRTDTFPFRNPPGDLAASSIDEFEPGRTRMAQSMLLLRAGGLPGRRWAAVAEIFQLDVDCQFTLNIGARTFLPGGTSSRSAGRIDR